MRNRNKRINVYLNEKEYQKLKHDASLSGLSISSFMREAITGQEIKALPPEEFYMAFAELRELKTLMQSIIINPERRQQFNVKECEDIYAQLDELTHILTTKAFK